MADGHIGYLIRSKHVLCRTCAEVDALRLSAATATHKLQGAAKLFRVNVEPYAQGCHQCGTLLVEPRTAAWPELFAPKDCPTCEREGTQVKAYREYMAQVVKA